MGTVSGLLIDGIGTLVTNDPDLGEGPLGLVRDAALVLDGGVVAWAGPRSRGCESSEPAASVPSWRKLSA